MSTSVRIQLPAGSFLNSDLQLRIGYGLDGYGLDSPFVFER